VHALLERLTQAICRGDAEAAAACFTESGVYHDGFYGEFKGRAAIAEMVRKHFHGNASDFSWTLSDVVAERDRGYASYEFSYTSKIPGAEGKRAGFTGICKVGLKDGLIERYEEIFERAQVLARLGFADARIVKSVRKWADG
jgi:uncharacterized protein (TIGR02246 family)